MMKKSRTKFLIIRFSSIGDIVLTTPVVRCLKQQFEGAEIHYVVKKKFASVLEHNPYIDRLHLLDNNLDELVDLFKAEHFDYVIDLHKTIRSYLLRIKLRRPVLTFQKLSVEKFLMNKLRINLLPKNVHIVERNLESVRPLGVKNDNRPVDYFISPQDMIPVNTLPLAFQNGYIAFVIGGQHFTKRMPVDKIISICKGLNTPVILLGGPEDAQTGNQIQTAVPDKVLNTCGTLHLNQSVSLLMQASTVIAHDTGLMHISGAFNKPIVSVWGGTSSEHFGVWPYLNDKQNEAVVNGLSCRPCSNFGLSKCPKGHFKCMVEQDEAFIINETEKFLSNQ